MPCAGGGPESAPPPHDAHSAARTRTAAALRPTRQREALRKFQIINCAKKQAKPAAKTHHSWLGGPDLGKSGEGKDVRTVVIRVTVAFLAFEPSGVTVGGENAHVVAAGAPAQLHVTA